MSCFTPAESFGLYVKARRTNWEWEKMTVDDKRAPGLKVEALLAQLTAEEKVNLVSGLGFNLNFRNPKRLKPSLVRLATPILFPGSIFRPLC